MKLIDIKEIKGTIELLSGLHIGAGDTEMHIGGTDNPVVRHPHTDEPYIPGSSIKGKVRSLLELKSGLMAETKGSPVKIGNLKTVDNKTEAEKILKLFGSGGDDKEDSSKIGPSRASFADCALNEDWKNENKGKTLFEVKAENTINRIKGTAEHPRQTERVPAGVVFDFSINLKIFDDEGDSLLEYLLEGLKLLERDALGGSGSRGYGRIKFNFEDDNIRQKFDEAKAFEK